MTKTFYNQKELYKPSQIVRTLKATKGTGNRPVVDLTQEALPQFLPQTSPTTTSSLADFLARLSLLLEKDEGLKIHEELYSLRYAEYFKIKNPSIFCLRTSKDCSHTTMGRHFTPLSDRLMNWGTTSNGRCLTARISESPRIGKECSLSDILEENPDPKYFLSEAMTQYILNKKHHKVAISTVPSEAKETSQW